MERGKNGIDADVAGIGAWTDNSGNEVEFPKGSNYELINKWAEENGLVWNWHEGKLKTLLSNYAEAYVMGSAGNAYSFSKLFDRVYFLKADVDLILRRLERRAMNGSSYHDNGRTEQQRAEIVRKMSSRTDQAGKLGFEFIDAALTPGQIYDIIVNG